MASFSSWPAEPSVPPLTLVQRGRPYNAIVNRVNLSFPTKGNALWWTCWEVEVSWADGKTNEPGRDCRCECIRKHMEQVFRHESHNDAPLWLYDERRRLYTQRDTWNGTIDDWADQRTHLKANRISSVHVDLGRLGREESSEEQRFVQIYLRQMAKRKPGRVVAGRRVYIAEQECIPWSLKDMPYGDIVEGRSLWLGWVALLDEAKLSDESHGLQLTINATAGFGMARQSLQHFIGSFFARRQEDQCMDLQGNLHSWWQRNGDFERSARILNQSKFGIRNMKVTTPHLQRPNERKIREISVQPPKDIWFELDGTWVTVQDYLQRKYQIWLKHPHLPCVDLGSGARKDWVPIELVAVLGGDRNFCKMVSEDMLGTLVKKLAVEPAQRLKWIENILWELGDLKSLGAQTDWTLLPLICRELNSQYLIHGDTKGKGKGQVIKFDDGFFRPGQLTMRHPPCRKVSWLLLNWVQDVKQADLHYLRDQLCAVMWKRGVEFDPNPYCLDCDCHELWNIEDFLDKHGKQWAVELVVALMPEKRAGNNLRIVLKAGAHALGIHSGVVTLAAGKGGKGGWKGDGKGKFGTNGKGSNGSSHDASDAMQGLVKRKLDNYSNKLLQRLGVLAELQNPHPLLSEGTLLLGADVRHEEGAASLAGMVGSCKPPFTRYYSTCRAQMPQQAREGERQRQSKEHIDDIGGMVRDLLLHYEKEVPASQGKPRRVVMIRDGVSEGQFGKHAEEIASLVGALPELESGVKPEVVWIVVQKRHQTRIFPDRKNGAEALSNGNVKPGIVADVGIAHPKYENWYAVSHKAIKGTAVPAHYFLLKNTTSFVKDDFVELVHQLCHMYPRAACAVSYPTPTYYADHLCEFAHELKTYYAHKAREFRLWEGAAASRPDTVEAVNALFSSRYLNGSPLQGSNHFC